MTSVFDLFKIGIGPSSSHTMGPMIAAKRFADDVLAADARAVRVTVELFGSLAWTGKGHATDRAVALGLLGARCDTIDPDDTEPALTALAARKTIPVGVARGIAFDPARDIVFDMEKLWPAHSNAMRFRAWDAADTAIAETVCYSIGGGFVLTEGEVLSDSAAAVPNVFRNAAELLALAEHRTISQLQRENERVSRADAKIDDGLDAIAAAMFACIDRGFTQEGQLPGGLKVRRRAKALHDALVAERGGNAIRPHQTMDWVSAYALAVNEENAAGARVVTAPTNGAAGVVPAVLRYARDFYPDYTAQSARDFLLTAAAIGAVIKRNASISGAEVGCQGEVGSAAAMAAAGLAAISGGTPRQIENAAEIALEHHLGMTCDPLGGLVQVPCIERNAIAAHKAIAAASLALRGDGTHRVTLDEAIETMRQTGVDMQAKYKETSRGGLAVNVAEC